MTILCEICMELIISTQDVKITTCGHLFHSTCVLQWIERQGHDTCPHCRSPQRSHDLIRVYLTSIVNEEDVQIVHLTKNCNAKELEENLIVARSTINTLKIDVNWITEENEELKLKLISMEDLQSKTLEEYTESQFKLSSALNQIEKQEKELEELKLTILSLRDIPDNTEHDKDFQACGEVVSSLKFKEQEKQLSAAKEQIAQLQCIQEALIMQKINDRKENIIKEQVNFTEKKGIVEPTKVLEASISQTKVLEASSSHNYRKRYNRNKKKMDEKSANENKQPPHQRKFNGNGKNINISKCSEIPDISQTKVLEASSSHNYRKRYNRNKKKFDEKSANENKQPPHQREFNGNGKNINISKCSEIPEVIVGAILCQWGSDNNKNTNLKKNTCTSNFNNLTFDDEPC